MEGFKARSIVDGTQFSCNGQVNALTYRELATVAENLW